MYNIRNITIIFFENNTGDFERICFVNALNKISKY